ncbi:Glycosyltransferase involved in cell wall bisynthesis [Zhouia amylolytica]|uniref:Glycosyltransferase involved in cell wall bisynthesis n=1 Tax=Zhouia amylolytica TaxID=376730 RepID=A0A1I6TDF5_9FLAO|nr:glycosyltransferase family 4 protein [Zhouia amylolytica]MCQ0112199.1 glycosyltransferase family 4 protein [Zhouia amylolytica]SFS87232.1 Glycosyltransferase involved in cell wall bisynthesis [Zhouia amylolytica]
MKKVLIITYYWPPAGGPGVQRWLKFVKYLRSFDIDPIVYIPENPNYPVKDPAFLKEVPEDITIIKQPIFEPYGVASVFSKKKTNQISKGVISSGSQSFIEKMMLWIRGNLFIPDARKFWINPSVTYLSRYLEENNIDTIITTGPPHSLHLIGLKLKRQSGIKWIADFRDPWTTIGYHKELKLTKNAAERHKELEHQVLNTADQITVTSYTTKKEFEELTAQPIEVITNGYDVSYFESVTPDEGFTLAHIGSLLSGRNPLVLWEVLSELKKESESFAKDLKINLVGVVSDVVVQSLKDYGLEASLSLQAYVTHDEALKMQRASQLLLLIEIDAKETQCIIPGKLFEYMAAERPILAIGPDQWDAAKIVRETNTGKTFVYDDKTRLKTAILEYYQAYKKASLKVHPIGLQKYSRKALTEHLSNVIKQL